MRDFNLIILSTLLLVSFAAVFCNNDDHHGTDGHAENSHGHDSGHEEHEGNAQHADQHSADSDHDDGAVEEPSPIEEDDYHDYVDHEDEDDDSDEAWHRFEKKYDDHYDPAEETRHKEIWKSTKHFINHEFKAKAAAEGYNFKVGVGPRSDQNTEDMQKHWTGLQEKSRAEFEAHGEPLPSFSRHKRQAGEHGQTAPARPASIDWRKLGGVTPVKHQRGLGACWAFAAAAVLETQLWKETKKLRSLSVEPFISCCALCYDYSRGSGWYKKKKDRSFSIASDSGSALDFAYQYGHIPNFYTERYIEDEKAPLSKTCKKKIELKEQVKTYYYVPKGDEEALMQGLANIGPAAIGLNVSDRAFKNFRGGGVFKDKTHCQYPTDHAMAVVGYGTMTHGPDKGVDYFIIKNSWGIYDFGDWGYMKYQRGLCEKDEHGITSDAIFPIYPYKTAK